MKSLTLCWILIASSFFIECADHSCRSDEALEMKLQSAISAAGSNKSKPVIDMKAIADFSWNELAIVPPYGHLEILAQKGIDTVCISTANSKYRDDICLLVFLNDKKVVKFLEYPRSRGDFTEVSIKQQIYHRNNAIFSVAVSERKTNGGEPIIEIFALK